MSQATGFRAWRNDGLVVLGAALAATPPLLLGWGPLPVALLAAGLPAAVFVLLGHAPGRPAAAGCVALILGSVMIGRPIAGGVPWPDLAVVAALVATATGAAVAADRRAGVLAPSASAPAEAEAGRWMTIIVATEGPADTAGSAVRLPRSPRRGPERRRLARLARGRGRNRSRTRPAVATP